MKKNNELVFDFKISGTHYQAIFVTKRNQVVEHKHGPSITDVTELQVWASAGKMKSDSGYEALMIPIGVGYATRHKDDKFSLYAARDAALNNFESAGTLFWTEEVKIRIAERIWS